AALLSSQICLIRRGRLVQAGPTQQVLARPESAEAARLLDYGNIFRATVAAHDVSRGLTLLNWHGTRLAAPLDDRLVSGQPVDWCTRPCATSSCSAPISTSASRRSPGGR
ncbi:MAG: hypothetical protein MUF56_09440, partial [Solirubrobacteraceae bacterium]|nr:hypothetical protein [Solirubrobacteraceae bacterium]